MLPLAQTAAYGGPALDMMRNSRELLLVTPGMVMPEVDGLAVLKAVAAGETLVQRHAIVMVTGQSEAAAHGRIKVLREHLGVSLVLKPFTIEWLLETLAAAERQWAARHGNAAGAEDATDERTRIANGNGHYCE
jgi:DNA-binding LytR/AlgR family response regulator